MTIRAEKTNKPHPALHAHGSAGRRSQKGGVLLEYVILLVCLLPVLVGVQYLMNPAGQSYTGQLFNPSGDYAGNFGLVGNAFHQSYTNVIAGASQPTP